MRRPRSRTNLVVHVDDHIIAFREVEHWYWPLAINTNDGPVLLTIWIAVHPGNVEVVCHSRGSSETCQRGNDCYSSNHVAVAVLHDQLVVRYVSE